MKPLPENSEDRRFKRIDQAADAFERAWAAPTQPDLRRFLTEYGWSPEDPDQSLARELVGIDIEHRWRLAGADGSTSRPTARGYANDLYGEGATPLPEWVLSEGALREHAGEADAYEDLKREYAEHPTIVGAFAEGGQLSTAGPSVVSNTQEVGLHVRCPHCHSPIELVPDDRLESILCSSCGSDFSLVSDPARTQPAGTVRQLAQFRLVERLGMGAFGSVWKAEDTKLDRTVAVKIPRQGQFDATQERAFLREAQNAAQLSHPNIVPVYEVGRDGDTLYIVSELVLGLTLADWLSGQQPTAREAAGLCAKVAAALDHAHARGVIHRDLKPSNIILNSETEPHLTDFGLAKRDAAEITMSMDGRLLGTPAYMSPEQARGDAHQADRRSDVYSLGVILFQMLTGELPFRGNTRMLIHQVIHDEPPGLRKLNASVPKDLETITLKCLDKDASKRYLSARELAEDLDRWIRGEPILATPTPTPVKLLKWAKRNRALAALVGIGVVFALGRPLVAIREQLMSQRLQAALDERAVALDAEKSASLEAAQALGESEAINRFLIEDLFGVDVQDFHSTAPTTVTQLLAKAETRIEDAFEGQPLVKARLRRAIGELHASQLQWSPALRNYRIALGIYESSLGPRSEKTLECMALVAVAHGYEGSGVSACEMWDELIKRSQGIELPEQRLSYWKYRRLQIRRAMEGPSRALELIRAHLEPRQGDWRESDWSFHCEAASAHTELGHLHDAEFSLETAKSLVGDKPNMRQKDALALAELNLAYRRGDLEAALEAAKLGYSVALERYGKGHPNAMILGENLAQVHGELGHEEERLAVLYQLLDDQAAAPPYRPACFLAHTMWEDALSKGNLAAAIDLMQRSDGLANQIVDREARRDFRVLPSSGLAFYPLTTTSPTEKEIDLARSSLRTLESLTPASPVVAQSRGLLAIRQGRYAEAIAPLKASQRMRFGDVRLANTESDQQRGFVRSGAAGFQWLRVRLEIQERGGERLLSWSLNGREIGQLVLDDEADEGFASVGYMDPFPSVSASSAHNFGLIDNLRFIGDKTVEFSFDDASLEPFDVLRSSRDTSVQSGFDYEAIGVPPAPGSEAGDSRGLRLAANIAEPGGAEAVRLVYPDRSVRALEFDSWISFVGPGPAGGPGATEFLTAGLLGDDRTLCLHTADGTGVWCTWNGSGDATRDYRFYKGKLERQGTSEDARFACGNLTGSTNPYFGGHGPRATDSLLLAIAYASLGQSDEAQAALRQANELLKQADSIDFVTQRFVEEASSKIAASEAEGP